MTPQALDDRQVPAPGDPEDMLGAVATAGAQLRDGATAATRARCRTLAALPTPRAVVVAGMGGSAAAGDVLSAVAAAGSRTQVVVHRGYGLPPWVGPDDLLVAVSCSGQTEETLSAVGEAVRRGVPAVTIGSIGSALSAAAADCGALHLPVDPAGRQPRACLWALAAPLLCVADAVGVVPVPTEVVDTAAVALDDIARRCRRQLSTEENPAKSLAQQLADGLPMVWGFSEVAAAAAYRFGCQLAENAKIPSVVGALSEPHHNQVVSFDTADRGLSARLRLLVLRDCVEDARLGRRAAESLRLAAEADLTARQVRAEGEHPLVRLAGLTGLLDFTSVYVALVLGVDPTPVAPIITLKSRLAMPADQRSTQ